MDPDADKNKTIHISSKSHLNITFNLYQCGNRQVTHGSLISIEASDVFIFGYVNKGAALLECNGLAFKLNESQGFFAFPDIRYEVLSACDELLDVTWLSFSGYMIEYYLNRANIFRARPIFSDPEGVVGKKLNTIYSTSMRLPNRYCRMMSILYDIFGILLDVNPTKRDINYVDSADIFAIKAVDYIERNFAKNISVSEIAEVLGISRKHLYAIFNDILNISPKQYLIFYRMEKACMRLKTSSQSLLEIAESVGYMNQFYFSKEFKRLTGMTPSEYRKNPNLSQVFSFHRYVPKLKEKYEVDNLSLSDEPNLTVYAPVSDKPIDLKNK